MKSKTKHIETKRLRKDYAFGRFVRIFGLLVLATFATLIFHILYNASPLFFSPSVQKNTILESSFAKISAGAIELNGDWLSINYDKCALSLSKIDSSSKEGAVKAKQFAPQCDKSLVGVFGANNVYVAMVTKQGIFEIYKFSNALAYELNLEASFALPSSFLGQSNYANWHIYFHNDQLFISQQNGQGSITLNHHLASLVEPEITIYESSPFVVPILARNIILSAKGNTLNVIDHKGNVVQQIQYASPIIQINAMQIGLDVAVITQTYELYKYSVFNKNGTFTLGLVFNDSLLPFFKPINEMSALTHEPPFSLKLEPQHSALLIFDKIGRLAIFNAVTGEHKRHIDLGFTPQYIDYFRGEFIARNQASFAHFKLENMQGMISLQTLFGKNQYSGYEKPEYLWQTSMSSDAQSAKYSIVPLIMGSIKASLLALVVAIPLALGSAIYTAYFASDSLRNKIKPLVEMLEAVPSVIIGFIAAIWLAPFAEQHLVVIFSVVLFFPLVVLFLTAMHSVLQPKMKDTNWYKWQFLLITLAFICIILVLSLFFNQLPSYFQSNDSVHFLNSYTLSKTAVVVSIALGIAISPTIYTLIDDAIYEVPDGVKQAAFALGASPVQTLFKVVLVVALPSIISAIMLGFGRAFGETMIVLMVTGNTPVANWDLFSGIRTLTSNLAIELQEAQVDSTLYHILFLTAALLFVFTFIINTMAALLKRRMHRGE